MLKNSYNDDMWELLLRTCVRLSFYYLLSFDFSRPIFSQHKENKLFVNRIYAEPGGHWSFQNMFIAEYFRMKINVFCFQFGLRTVYCTELCS